LIDGTRDCSVGDRESFVPPKRVGALQAPARFGGAISRAVAMQQVFAALSRLAPTGLTVTLIGETGTGKDVLAHAIHERSARADKPFVVFDCGAVAANLAESELFGYERGAFTGAVLAHAGAFEQADGGTLFLDEIGELPLELQPRLLRALENRTVQRVGGKRYRSVDLRIIAATHRDLPARVAEKSFREDLFFRLTTAIIPVPALRQRLDDLSLLVPALLADIGRPQLEVSPETYAAVNSGPATCVSSRTFWRARAPSSRTTHSNPGIYYFYPVRSRPRSNTCVSAARHSPTWSELRLDKRWPITRVIASKPQPRWGSLARH